MIYTSIKCALKCVCVCVTSKDNVSNLNPLQWQIILYDYHKPLKLNCISVLYRLHAFHRDLSLSLSHSQFNQFKLSILSNNVISWKPQTNWHWGMFVHSKLTYWKLVLKYILIDIMIRWNQVRAGQKQTNEKRKKFKDNDLLVHADSFRFALFGFNVILRVHRILQIRFNKKGPFDRNVFVLSYVFHLNQFSEWCLFQRALFCFTVSLLLAFLKDCSNRVEQTTGIWQSVHIFLFLISFSPVVRFSVLICSCQMIKLERMRCAHIFTTKTTNPEIIIRKFN